MQIAPQLLGLAVLSAVLMLAVCYGIAHMLITYGKDAVAGRQKVGSTPGGRAKR